MKSRNDHYTTVDLQLDPMRLPCGGVAYYDQDSGIAYRCGQCLAVVGSIGQPQECKDIAEKWDNWQKLGGQGWDYYAEAE
jgi:hypothetical protein